MIAISLIPNFETSDIKRSGEMLINPKKSLGYGDKVVNALETFFGRKAVITESGRIGLYVLLKALDIKEGDEVIIQALTCSVVPGSIVAAGGKPVYVDIDTTYNLDLNDLAKKINSKTKAVIVQNTFGKPAKIAEILKLCRAKKIMVIEDLAHGLGNSYNGKPLGTWGDAAFLSFGRDKVISGVWGGAVIGNQKLIEKINKLMETWPRRDKAWIQKQLWYPILMNSILKTYDFGIGKGLHKILRSMGLLSEVITKSEKKGKMMDCYQSLPDELAYLIWHQWQKLPSYIAYRKKIARYYATNLEESGDETSTFLRYPLLVNNPFELRKLAASQNIFLGDWYDQIVAPKSVALHDFGYKKGSCPKAEENAGQIINLPTGPNTTLEEARKVVEVLKKWKSKN